MRIDRDVNSPYDRGLMPGGFASARTLKESVLPSLVVQEEMYG